MFRHHFASIRTSTSCDETHDNHGLCEVPVKHWGSPEALQPAAVGRGVESGLCTCSAG
jgi:hypothetical protein